jgi:hypothetical protein
MFAAVVSVALSVSMSSTTAVAKSSYITPEGAARMMAVKGIKAQWTTARQICAEAGLERGSPQFRRCFEDYQIHSLRALRTRARALTDTVARQYGLCIDRRRFEIARCTEI